MHAKRISGVVIPFPRAANAPAVNYSPPAFVSVVPVQATRIAYINAAASRLNVWRNVAADTVMVVTIVASSMLNAALLAAAFGFRVL